MLYVHKQHMIRNRENMTQGTNSTGSSKTVHRHINSSADTCTITARAVNVQAAAMETCIQTTAQTTILTAVQKL
jgi:uncharacterized protein YutE (UPF0331/DUF86 family)